MSIRLRLEPWSEGDFELLVRNNAPEMTDHLGGPESDEKLADRHRRYLALRESEGRGQMFRISAGPDAPSAGSIGYWETTWQGEPAWETGWGVLPEFQGRGIAAAAARLVAERAREAGRHRHLHAFPSVDHPASNGVCRKAGFTLLGECAFEYPKGHWMRCNDWRLELA
ncbi:GNAT family N-acetyltransferase [Actinomycetota bacterium Odt1-20B]